MREKTADDPEHRRQRSPPPQGRCAPRVSSATNASSTSCLVAALEEQARRIDELHEEVRRGKHGIAAARRQSLAAEWRVEELQRRLAEADGDTA